MVTWLLITCTLDITWFFASMSWVYSDPLARNDLCRWWVHRPTSICCGPPTDLLVLSTPTGLCRLWVHPITFRLWMHPVTSLGWRCTHWPLYVGGGPTDLCKLGVNPPTFQAFDVGSETVDPNFWQYSMLAANSLNAHSHWWDSKGCDFWVYRFFDLIFLAVHSQTLQNACATYSMQRPI